MMLDSTLEWRHIRKPSLCRIKRPNMHLRLWWNCCLGNQLYILDFVVADFAGLEAAIGLYNCEIWGFDINQVMRNKCKKKTALCHCPVIDTSAHAKNNIIALNIYSRQN